MKCQNCEREIPAGKRFCGYCGQPQAPEGAPSPISETPFDEDAPTILYDAEPLDETPPGPDKLQVEGSAPAHVQEVQESVHFPRQKEVAGTGENDTHLDAKVGMGKVLQSFPWVSWMLLIAGWLIRFVLLDLF